MADLKGTILAAPIKPTSELDTYPTHLDEYGNGGFRVVDNIAARNNITPERRKDGMLVYVKSDDALYQLMGGILNSHWKLFNISNSKRIIPFETTDQFVIENVDDYSIVEVYTEDPFYKPSLWNDFQFNRALFNQTFQFAAKIDTNFTAFYIQDDQQLVISLPALKSGIVVLR
jgi:hypothetical protein